MFEGYSSQPNIPFHFPGRIKNYHPRTTSDSPRVQLYKSSTPWRSPQASTFLTQCTWTFSSPLHIRTHLKHNALIQPQSTWSFSLLMSIFRATSSYISCCELFSWPLKHCPGSTFAQQRPIGPPQCTCEAVATKTLSRIHFCSTKVECSSVMSIFVHGEKNFMTC